MKTVKDNKSYRITIRLTKEELDSLNFLAKLTYRSGSISRLIRYYLQPVFDQLKNVSHTDFPSSSTAAYNRR